MPPGQPWARLVMRQSMGCSMKVTMYIDVLGGPVLRNAPWYMSHAANHGKSHGMFRGKWQMGDHVIYGGNKLLWVDSCTEFPRCNRRVSRGKQLPHERNHGSRKSQGLYHCKHLWPMGFPMVYSVAHVFFPGLCPMERTMVNHGWPHGIPHGPSICCRALL